MKEIIILDTETTGVDPLVDKIVEIAAINLHTDLTFETLVNPGRGIPPEAMAIHHITEWMVEGKPAPFDAMTLFTRWAIQNKAPGDPAPILAAHNAKFDKGMIEPLLGFSPQWLCTYKSAVMLWPDAPGHSNQVLRYWLGLKPQIPEGLAPHRAMYDIICTREILRVQLQQASLDQLLQWSSGPILLPKVTFGKHKGKTWDQVDNGYLNWCLGQQDMNEDVLHTAEYWLGKRGGFRRGR
jgi:exodeoxyribonuclease X